MRRFLRWSFLSLFLFLTLYLWHWHKTDGVKTVPYASFEELSGKGTPFWKHLSKKDQSELKNFKRLYERNYPLKEVTQKIPKTLHYIWLGPKDFPADSIAYVDSWKKYHPDWTIKFWTDRQRPAPTQGMEIHFIAELPLKHVKDLLEKTENYGERSDLLRYEILAAEGGVYVDHDVECFQSLDPFTGYDFFAGLEPPHTNVGTGTRVFPCNAVIGVRPNHPILNATLDSVAARWDSVENKYPGKDPRTALVRVINRTFHSFTLAAKKEINKGGNKDILFPASFFYPDRIIPESVLQGLKQQGLVVASHKCVGYWKDSAPESGLVDVQEYLENSRKRLSNKLRRTEMLLYANLGLTTALLFVYFRKRKSDKSHEIAR